MSSRIRRFRREWRKSVATLATVFVVLAASLTATFAGAATPSAVATTTVVGSAARPQGGGWTVTASGTVSAFGGASTYGSPTGPLDAPVVGIASTPDGDGYWLAAADGGVFSYGDAYYYGSEGGTHLNQPIVGIAATPDGDGYWLVASDGGVFTFGDAGYYGSEGNIHLNKPVVGIASTPDGNGYWLVASDGGVFTFGDAHYYGSLASTPAIVVTSILPLDGGYYQMVESNGTVVPFTMAGSPVGASATTLPSSILDLSNWELTLPIGPAKDATIVAQPQLATFADPYFHANDLGTGVVFTAPADGSTTSGSDYPRSELREMTDGGTQEASWTNKDSSVNTLTVNGAALALPPVKPQLVVAQIHNSSSDVVEVLVDGENPTGPGTVKIGVRLDGHEQSTYLDPAYVLGTPYTLTLTAADGHILISYDGVQTFDFSVSGSGWYFKAGAYTQSNPSHGDSGTAVGESIIYSVAVNHT